MTALIRAHGPGGLRRTSGGNPGHLTGVEVVLQLHRCSGMARAPPWSPRPSD